ncbi:MAG TPA: cyclic nucleotide-binding domain-containing protein [Candidatus Nitrosotenuis sp.]|jgi:CRP-like cAMP-binding protein|nr:cyclic nucleotide-binding domain-containing protein [Candidatus Nitrosotenuis sp.]
MPEPDDSFLRRILLLEELDEAERRSFGAALVRRELKRDEMLFREHEAGDEMFFVESGSLVLGRQLPDGSYQPFARMGPGDAFGEMALLEQLPRSLGAMAEEDSVVWGLSARRFEELIQSGSRSSSRFLLTLCRVISQRLRRLDEQMADFVSWVRSTRE